MSEEEHKPTENQASGNRALRVLLGLGLMVPACICCMSGNLLPTILTLNLSLQEWKGLGSPEFIGFDNYSHLFSDKLLGQAAVFTILMVVVRLLIIAVLPLLLALGVNAFGRAVRIPVRLAFTVPLALYTPVALALSWSLALNPRVGIVKEPLLINPETARMTFLLLDGLFVMGLAAGLGLVFYLAALRGSGEEPPALGQVRKPLIAVWVISLLATVALTLQAFDWSWVMTGGGPIGSTTTLALHQYKMGFARMTFGYGAAVAVPPLLIMLLSGAIAGLVVVLANLQLELVPLAKAPAGNEGRSKSIFGLILALALLCGVVGCLLNAGAIPAALSAGSGMPGRGPEIDSAQLIGRSFLVNTVILQLAFVLLFQIPLTYLAALGIGGLRPLGRHSEWLLMLFSPWLFVAAGPLMFALYQQWRSVDLLGTLPAAMGPFWISIPILFTLTLFFRGREKPYQEAVAEGQSPFGAFFSKVVGPSLPLTLLLALAAILVGMQRLQWPSAVSSSDELWPMPVMLAQIAGMYGSSPTVLSTAIGIFVIPVFLAFLVAFGIFQVVYMDRLALCGPAGPVGPVEPQAVVPVEEPSTAEPETMGSKAEAEMESSQVTQDKGSPKPKPRKKSPKAAQDKDSPKPRSRKKSSKAPPAEE